MKTIYKNKIIDVYEDEVNLPNGISFERVFIKTGNKVIVVPISEDNKFLLGNFFSPIAKTLTLRFPRGSIDENESLIEAAKRELLEETGYKGEKLTPLPNNYYPNPAWHNEHWRIVYAENISKENVTTDKLEDLGIVLLTEKEIEHKIKNGEICDASTIVAFYVTRLASQGEALRI